MPNKHFCQGPRCHEQVTQDRFLKSRGVVRGRYASLDMSYNTERNGYYDCRRNKFFCSQGCYNDFANTYVREVIALHPRTEALETPIDVEIETRTDWHGQPYATKVIKAIDNNGG